MMEEYFAPLEADRFAFPRPGDIRTSGPQACGRSFFPSWKARIAIFGGGRGTGTVQNAGCAAAPDAVREKFYALKTGRYAYNIPRPRQSPAGRDFAGYLRRGRQHSR